jgi:hypothetical protein
MREKVSQWPWQGRLYGVAGRVLLRMREKVSQWPWQGRHYGVPGRVLLRMREKVSQWLESRWLSAPFGGVHEPREA